jgi:hypothetical protein
MNSKNNTINNMLTNIVNKLIISYGEDTIENFFIENESVIYDYWFDEIGKWNSIIEEDK